MKHESTIEKIVASMGAKLYGVETEKQGDNLIYRVLVQSEQGVSLDMCESISRTLSPILDLDPPLSGGYFLEVSSPGIERKLKTLSHFQSSVGELVKVVLKSGEKHQGKLLNVEGEDLVIDEQDPQRIPFSSIVRARTYFEW